MNATQIFELVSLSKPTSAAPLYFDALGNIELNKERAEYTFYISGDSYMVSKCGPTAGPCTGCVGTFHQALRWLAGSVLFDV